MGAVYHKYVIMQDVTQCCSFSVYPFAPEHVEGLWDCWLAVQQSHHERLNKRC